MPDDQWVTRREIDLLKAAADAEREKIWQRLEFIDDHGTRGVQGLTVRIDMLIGGQADLKAEVRTDMKQLAADMDARFEAHEKVHDREAADRKNSHQWRVTTTWAAAASIATVLGLLIDLLTRVH